MRKQFGWLGKIIVTAVVCTFGVGSATAEVKIIGDFEGNLDSPYAGDWAGGALVTPEFIAAADPLYVGGVTHGDQALLLTTPDRWDGDVYFRLGGGEDMMRDMATLPYLMFDVTTYGGPDTPEEGPQWRQVFNIFNNHDVEFYDTNLMDPLHDTDLQRDFPVASFVDASVTSTVVVDMTGPDPSVDGDGVNFIQRRAQQELADHTDGTPIENLYWEILWVFQGDNTPDTNQIQMVIDNVRLCDTLDCTPSAVLAGDYNEDGSVDAADYVVWRNNLNGTTLPNETVSPGIVDQEDFTEWRAHFQSAALGAAGGSAVPEPTGVLLALSAIASVLTMKRVRR